MKYQVRIILGLLVITVGLSLLFDVPLLRFIFPLLLIWIGWRILTGKGEAIPVTQTSQSSEDTVRQVLILSGINKRFMTKDFKGGEIVAIFGGGEIDLRDVQSTAKRVDLDVVAIFGGLKIMVPKEWTVRSEGVGILGGYDNRTTGDSGIVELRVKGAAIFGGVELVD